MNNTDYLGHSNTDLFENSGTKYLEIKAELLTVGLEATPAALQGVGTSYKAQNHGLFGWDFENHVDLAVPDDFELPDGTIVQFRKNRRSPYLIDLRDGKLVLSNGKEDLCTVKWLPQPEFYSKKTSSGHDMVRIGQLGGADCLFFCYQNYCSHFARDEQCLFCNLVSTSDTYDSVMRKKSPQDIGEVAAEAFREGETKHIMMTGGCLNSQKEIELVSRIVGSIAEHIGRERVPGTILPSPAKRKEDLQKYYDSGINGIGFSLEIWDEKMYKAVCPGKSKSVSHDEFVQSVKHAVDIFGEGNAWAVFVAGLEPKKTFLEGIRELSSIGANVLPFVWAPNPGSKLEGHRAPSSEWYVETMLEAADIVKSAGVPPGTDNHCFRCDGNSLLHDALRVRGVE